jgi:hypothetical protein
MVRLQKEPAGLPRIHQVLSWGTLPCPIYGKGIVEKKGGTIGKARPTLTVPVSNRFGHE